MIHFIFHWNISQLDQGSGNWLKEWKKKITSHLTTPYFQSVSIDSSIILKPCSVFLSLLVIVGQEKWKWLDLMESGVYCLMASNWRAGNLEITIKMLDQRAIWHSVVLLRTSSFAFILTIGRPNHCKKDEHGLHHDLVEPTRKELAE